MAPPPLDPEDAAREKIDKELIAAGWVLQNPDAVNLHAGIGVVVRYVQLKSGFGEADYLIFLNAKACGVIEAKKEGTTLTGVEIQAEKYSVGLPDIYPAHLRPLPFLYQSTGSVTQFTSRLDPDSRSRQVFQFHRPETLAALLSAQALRLPAKLSGGILSQDWPTSLRGRFRLMPELHTKGLWPAQGKAVKNLEKSLVENHPRALIQMATGSGKTFTAITAAYRLIKDAKAGRVLFLVDRGNLGKQAEKEFQNYTTPDDGRKFTELYNVQRLTSNRIDPVAKVVITTIQRLYSMLRGDEELAPELEEGSQFATGGGLIKEPPPVVYNASIPIEFFDVVFIDECHRSIYTLWRQVLEYFDCFLVGLTATPAKQTFGFFNQNLVMEYGHEEAVADGVNVDYDVYKIRTRITESGSTVEAGPVETVVGLRNRETRSVRWQKLDDDLTYDADALDRKVVARDQIRTIAKTFKERLFTEIFPGRREVPKTLIYAKDDSHADDIVQLFREVFGKGNEFCEKITYRTGTARIVDEVTQEITYRSTGVTPDDLLSSFRNSYNPRIVVTVDMIATGTDIKPLEVVMFMRAVKSRNFFEQMKGRGVRVIDKASFQAVTPDAKAKTRFVLIDCVGVLEQPLTDTPPMDKKRNVSLEKLLQAVAFGNTEPDVLSSVASRLARLDRQLDKGRQSAIRDIAGGMTLTEITHGLVEALSPDAHIDAARKEALLPDDAEPKPEQVEKARIRMLAEAIKPLASNPKLREHLVEYKKDVEQTIDDVSPDEVLEAGYSEQAKERAKTLIESFKKYIEENKDEITALQVLYSVPHRRRLRFQDIKVLADVIQAPPRSWTPEVLWRAYESLEKDKVRGASGPRLLTDLVSLIKFTIHQENVLVPFQEHVKERFTNWLAQQANRGKKFTPEQTQWLELIRDHIATSMQIEKEDFDAVPFNQLGGLGKVHQLFGKDLEPILEELNEVLAA